MPFDAAKAAAYIAEAHRMRAPYRNLPEDIAPRTVADAYATQEALRVRWEPQFGPVVGLKIATTTKVMQALMGIDHPCGGMLYEKRMHAGPAAIRAGDFMHLVVECELAVRLVRDLPKMDTPHTRESVRAAVGDVMAAYELIEDRNAVYKDCRALSLIADNAWNGGVVLGGAVSAPAGNLDGLAARVAVNGRETLAGRSDDPMGALAWVANLAADRGRPMTAGMAVITGSLVPTFSVAPGDEVRFEIDGIGAVEMTIG